MIVVGVRDVRPYGKNIFSSSSSSSFFFFFFFIFFFFIIFFFFFSSSFFSFSFPSSSYVAPLSKKDKILPCCSFLSTSIQRY
jgi:hypothetical protein